MGASGGDMAMTADVARSLELDFAPIPDDKAAVLRELLGRPGHDRQSVRYPHLPVVRSAGAQARVRDRACTRATMQSDSCSTFRRRARPTPPRSMPRSTYSSRPRTIPRASVALIASLPETISERVRKRCLEGGVVPLQGQREALEAFALAGAVGDRLARGTRRRAADSAPRRAGGEDVYSLSESEARPPCARSASPFRAATLVKPSEAAAYAESLGFPVVIKAAGAHLEHKTEVGGVALNIKSAAEAEAAAQRLERPLRLAPGRGDDHRRRCRGADRRDRRSTIRAGAGAGRGRRAHRIARRQRYAAAALHTPQSIAAALRRLTVAKLLGGFRGKPAGDMPGAHRAPCWASPRYAERQHIDAAAKSTSIRSSCGPPARAPWRSMR